MTLRSVSRDIPHFALQLLTSRGENDWSQHVAETAAETGLSGTNGLFEVASRTYREKLRRSQASMDEADYSSSSDEEGPAVQQSRTGTQLIRSHSILRSVMHTFQLRACMYLTLLSSLAVCRTHNSAASACHQYFPSALSTLMHTARGRGDWTQQASLCC